MSVQRIAWLLFPSAILLAAHVCETSVTAGELPESQAPAVAAVAEKEQENLCRSQPAVHGFARRWTPDTLSGNGWQPSFNGGMLTDDVFDDVQLVIRWRTGGAHAVTNGLPAKQNDAKKSPPLNDIGNASTVIALLHSAPSATTTTAGSSDPASAAQTVPPHITIPLTSPELGGVVVSPASSAAVPHSPKQTDTKSHHSPGSVRPAMATSTEENELRFTRIANSYRCVVNGLETARGELPSAAAVQIALLTGTNPLAITSIEITELNHASLFDGRSLDGWEPAANLHAPDLTANTCWLVNDGNLTCNGTPGPWLRSSNTWGDFNLRLEYRLSPGGNSGVYLRVPADGTHHRDTADLPPAGVEVQILDDAAPQYSSLRRDQYAGGLYAIAGVQQKVARPAGEWNSMEINLRGDSYTVRHNGVQVLRCTSLTHPQLALRQRAGHLGLQNHDSYIEYRNIRIGPAESR